MHNDNQANNKPAVRVAYVITTSDDTHALMAQVCGYMAQGYVPAGGIATFVGKPHRDDSDDRVMFAQALVIPPQPARIHNIRIEP